MTCAHNDEGGGWRKALDEDIIGLRAGLAFDRVGARDCLAVPDGAFGVRSHQCIERVIAQTALCAPTGKHQQLVPDGISAAHNRRHRYTFLLVQHCLQRFKKLTHRRFPLWMPLNASIHAHQSRRSTKTWIVPPQARPICSIFSSSVMPNSSICGLPSSITSIAASTTAGSTQPPLTEPDSSPLSLTASFAPGWRGAEPAILTTVAMATRSPRARQRSMSGNTSRMVKTSCSVRERLLAMGSKSAPGRERQDTSSLSWVCSTRQQLCGAPPGCAQGGCRQCRAASCPGKSGCPGYGQAESYRYRAEPSSCQWSTGGNRASRARG